MQITCSNCGARQRFKYSATNVNNLIALGWNSFGSALYCPKCVETWKEQEERNDTGRPLAGSENTISVIDDWAEMQR